MGASIVMFDMLKKRTSRTCYASTFVKDIRESYAIKEICRRL